MTQKYFYVIRTLLRDIANLLLLSTLVLYPQNNDSTLTKPKPDYRNKVNLPAYDPSLMPLKTVRRGTGVWTELNPKVPRVDYFGIHFINKDTGWACGKDGVIIKTTNGGINWTISSTPTTTLLLKVHSYNGQVVIATGYDGIILRSTDGGETFLQVTSGVGSGRDLWGLEMLNDTVGWVCGKNQTLLKTTNAGLSWEFVNAGLNQHYWSLDFLDEQYGMIACGSGKVLRTTNGGNSWTQIQAGDTRALYTIDIIDSLHIAAAGGPYGKNVYSSNGGITWLQNADLIYENGVNCISFINADTGYAIGENWAIRKTENRGVTWWASDPVYTEWWLNLLPNGVGYAVGTKLRIYKTSNGYDNWEGLFLNDNFKDVHFIDETTGFIVSDDWLYKTTDGGNRWKRKDNAPGGNEILFLDSLIGFIGGSQTMYKTTDGGNSWYQVNGVPSVVRKIFFINKTLGWATSGRGIIKTTDGGENWFWQIVLPADTYTSIYFIDSLNGWATSRYIWQTTNGGANWIQRTDVPAFFCDDVYFYNYLRGWIIAGNELYATSNGGNSWTLDPQIYTYSRNFETISNTHFIITGTNIYESIDTGYTWQNITSIVGNSFISLQAPREYLAYGVGRFGYIVRYLDSTVVPVELSIFTAEILDNQVLLHWTTETETNNLGFEIFRSNDRLNWQSRGFVLGKGTSTIKSYYTFYDKDIFGNNFYYKLKQIDYNGKFTFTDVIEIAISAHNYYLSQNYPNPANPETNIIFSLPVKTVATISLYSITGELLAEIINEEKEKGIYKIEFNLSKYSSGIYFYRITTNSGYSATKKLILIK